MPSVLSTCFLGAYVPLRAAAKRERASDTRHTKYSFRSISPKLNDIGKSPLKFQNIPETSSDSNPALQSPHPLPSVR